MTTPVLELQELIANQAQPHLLLNFDLRRLEQVGQISVLSANTVNPPVSPADGVAYIVPAGATGAWSGQLYAIAYYAAGWQFITPGNGWIAYVADLDEYFRFATGSPGGWTVLNFGGTTPPAPLLNVNITDAPGTGPLNDYVPTLWNAAQTTKVRSAAASGGSTFTGLDATGVQDGALVFWRNTSAADIETFNGENAGSAAANRFLTPGGLDFVLPPGAAMFLVYDLNRWVVK